MADILFENVSMKYNEDSLCAIENINFSINKGETIGIIGGTGSGKTSVINLLTRFYEVSSGSIYIDGYNVTSYEPKELREKIGIVLQKAVLFKGTIRENILWGNSTATDKDIYKALEDAQALDIIKQKENGLDEIIEQNGRNLSGGQRQRISIARALIKKPDILILDDSSSALDYLTDYNLRTALKNLDYKPTIIMVSQRTSSIEHADKIVVLDEGEMVGFDTHDNLLKNCKVYKEIYNSQFKGGSLDE